jgi:hypothetical protein
MRKTRKKKKGIIETPFPFILPWRFTKALVLQLDDMEVCYIENGMAQSPQKIVARANLSYKISLNHALSFLPCWVSVLSPT